MHVGVGSRRESKLAGQPQPSCLPSLSILHLSVQGGQIQHGKVRWNSLPVICPPFGRSPRLPNPLQIPRGSLQKSNFSYKDILVELPVAIHNSHLLTSLLHQLPSAPLMEQRPPPVSRAALSQEVARLRAPLNPNLDCLDLSIDPFLEKTCDLLLDSIETHYTEQNNHQYHQRQLGREQAKIAQWQQKRKAENAARVAAKQTPLPEDEWARLFKLPQEPSRLETLLNSRQVEQYARQVDTFSATVSGKMFAVRGHLLPDDGSIPSQSIN